MIKFLKSTSYIPLHFRFNYKRMFSQLISIALISFPLIISIESVSIAKNYRYTDPKVTSIYTKKLSAYEISSELSKTNPALRYYKKPAGSDVYAVIVTFDLKEIPSECIYKKVEVLIRPDKGRIVNGSPDVYKTYDEEVKIISAIPLSIDRSAEKSTSWSLAAEYAKAASNFSLNAGYKTSEKYVKLYRTVTTHLDRQIRWIFIPFKDEPIQPGTYFVIGFIEVPSKSVNKLLNCGIDVNIVKKGFFFNSGDCCNCVYIPKFYQIK